MAQGSFFGDWLYWRLLKRLAVVAATKLSGLTPCGALLAALSVGSAPLLQLLVGVPASTAYASPLNSLRCTTTVQGRIDVATAGEAIPINTGKRSQSPNLGKTAPDRAVYTRIGSFWQSGSW